jgi:hypothetical protein
MTNNTDNQQRQQEGHTLGKLVVNHFLTESSIYSPLVNLGIAKLKYYDFPYSELEVQANAERIAKTWNGWDALTRERDELREALKNIIDMNTATSNDELISGMKMIAYSALNKTNQ